MQRSTAWCLPALLLGTVPAQDLRRLDLPQLQSIEYDPSRQHTLALSTSGDSMSFDGTHWRRLPVPLRQLGVGRLAYDSFRDQMLHVTGDVGARFVTSRFDGLSWTELAPPVSPPPRWRFALSFDAWRGEAVLFGGVHATTLQALDDTWVFDGQHWQQRTPQHSPAASNGSSSSFDLLRGVTVLYRAEAGETWEWDGVDWSARLGSSPPMQRFGAAMTYDLFRQQTLLFGGGTASVQHDDLWAWDGNTWTSLAPVGATPPAFLEPRLTFDRALGETVLTDGYDSQDTWLWNGSRWLLRAGPRTLASVGGGLAFASPAGDLHVYIPNGPQTWRWDGTEWIDVPGIQPPARFAAVATTGPGHGYVLGGLDATITARTDLWGFDGSQWQLLSTTAPPNRVGQALAFDGLRNELVCFGGASPVGNVANAETWIFDGTAWQQRHPTHSPTARSQASATFDPTRGTVILHGGVSPTLGYTDETWEWNGSDWSPVPSITPPPPMNVSPIAFDHSRNATVLLGQDGTNRLLAWQLSVHGWSSVPLGAIDPQFGFTNYPLHVIGSPQPHGLLLVEDSRVFHLDIRQATTAVRGTPCSPGAPALAPVRWPALGESAFAIDVLRAPPTAAVAVVIGFQATSLAVGPCTLLVQNGAAALLATSAYGSARLPMPIPAAPAFLGLTGHCQAAVLDVTAPLGFTFSAGLDFTIGS